MYASLILELISADPIYAFIAKIHKKEQCGESKKGNREWWCRKTVMYEHDHNKKIPSMSKKIYS